MNVIVIDDEPVICNGLSELINKYEEWKIAGVFSNAEEALENCDWDNIQAAFVDINMPGLNGLEMIHILRERGYDTPVIFITAYAKFEYARQAIQEKAVDYLLKPLSNEELMKALRKAGEIYLQKLEIQESAEYIAANLYDLRKQFFYEVLFEEKVIKEDEISRKKRQYGLERKQYVVLEFITLRTKGEIKKILNRECENISDWYLYGQEYFFVFIITQEDAAELPIISELKKKGIFKYSFEDKAFDINELPDVYQRLLLKIRNLLYEVGPEIDSQTDIDQEEIILKKDMSLPIQEVMEYIEANLSRPLSLKGIASEVYLHPTYLSNQFKKQTGYTMVEYINWCRIRKAKQLLKEPQNKVSWVMEQVGFVNSRYFCKVFKDITGENPTQYKQNEFLKSRK